MTIRVLTCRLFNHKGFMHPMLSLQGGCRCDAYVPLNKQATLGLVRDMFLDTRLRRCSRAAIPLASAKHSRLAPRRIETTSNVNFLHFPAMSALNTAGMVT